MPGILGAFLEVVDKVAGDEAMKKRDPDLVKWCIMVQGVRSMAPRSFPAQVGYFFIFLYFTGFLTSVLLSPFRH